MSEQPKGVKVMPSYRWAACSVREFGPVGEKRHLVREGALTTVCGHSATHSDIWCADKRKPKCATCLPHETRLLPPSSASAGA